MRSRFQAYLSQICTAVKDLERDTSVYCLMKSVQQRWGGGCTCQLPDPLLLRDSFSCYGFFFPLSSDCTNTSLTYMGTSGKEEYRDDDFECFQEIIKMTDPLVSERNICSVAEIINGIKCYIAQLQIWPRAMYVIIHYLHSVVSRGVILSRKLIWDTEIAYGMCKMLFNTYGILHWYYLALNRQPRNVLD